VKSNKFLRVLVVLSVLIVAGLVLSSNVSADGKYNIDLYPLAGKEVSIHRVESDGSLGENVFWAKGASNDPAAHFVAKLSGGYQYRVFFAGDPHDQGQVLDLTWSDEIGTAIGPFQFWPMIAPEVVPELAPEEPVEEVVAEETAATVQQYVLYATTLDVEITAGENVEVGGGLRNADWEPVMATIYLEMDEIYTTTTSTTGEFTFSLPPYETAGMIRGKLWADSSNQIPVVARVEPKAAKSVAVDVSLEATPGELLQVSFNDIDAHGNLNPTSESYDVTASIGGGATFLTYNDFTGNNLQFTSPGDVGDIITIEVEGDTGLKGTTEVTLVEELEDVAAYTMITIPTGVTLSGLATMFGTSVEELVRLNGIPNPDMIIAGKPLIVSVVLMM